MKCKFLGSYESSRKKFYAILFTFYFYLYNYRYVTANQTSSSLFFLHEIIRICHKWQRFGLLDRYYWSGRKSWMSTDVTKENFCFSKCLVIRVSTRFTLNQKFLLKSKNPISHLIRTSVCLSWKCWIYNYVYTFFFFNSRRKYRQMSFWVCVNSKNVRLFLETENKITYFGSNSVNIFSISWTKNIPYTWFITIFFFF